jgi:hypothetical protein
MTVTQQISPPEHDAMGHMTEASSEGTPLELDGPPPEDDASPEDEASPEDNASPEDEASPEDNAPPEDDAPPEADAPPEDPPTDEGPASSSLLFEDLVLLPQPAASARPSEPAATSEITRTFRPM